jgi:aromatic-amino-acid transaminase
VYCDDNGKIPLLGAVKAAEKARLEASPRAATSRSKAWPPTTGGAEPAVRRRLRAAQAAGRVITCEALGGTGALKVGADYLKRLLPEASVYISDPSWENHRALFEGAGFTVENYAYYDAATRGVNFAGMKACAGGDAGRFHRRPARLLPQPDRRRPLARRNGRKWSTSSSSATSSPSSTWPTRASPTASKPDAIALDLFAASGLQFFVSSSFSKSFSLYGERVGALSIVTASKDESARVLSQVKRVVRTNYSNPPTHGGAVVAAVLASPELRQQWENELAGMRERIRAMRMSLVEKLKARRGGHRLLLHRAAATQQGPAGFTTCGALSFCVIPV